MSECRFIVYFEYAERRGEKNEVFNGCPKGGVVIGESRDMHSRGVMLRMKGKSRFAQGACGGTSWGKNSKFRDLSM